VVVAAMTLIGIWLTGPDRGFAWADTECYDANRGFAPSRNVQKMAVNEQARAAVVANGCILMLDIAAEAMAATDVFDLFVDDLPRLARRDWRPIDAVPRATALAVGYSHALRRMVGFCFDSRESFRPKRVITAEASPYVAGIEALHPTAPADILPFAQSQLREIRKLYPAAGGGSVTIAEVSSDSVGLQSFDLQTGSQQITSSPIGPVAWSRSADVCPRSAIGAGTPRGSPGGHRDTPPPGQSQGVSCLSDEQAITRPILSSHT
jgi:hypothetical protein